ncbi:hypothetical protein K505DRAFT_407704 [Melanomma pulvis-pyrius CBS 109.77]|uniref:SnoaL-like domain-containing protein n=1 Tax=Melanomma pulvis-pyrius CBS 109.77 TaxID=1314802 RepID=A0A6A6XDV0_9PLEO|nr:hypothetical protein K505DRAFT_407704 [Melanomma pulvis-pyrius CBS 109.77]
MTPERSDDPYTSEYPPGCNIDPDIKAFIKHYYTQVDTQGKHAEYSECWSDDGVLIVPHGKSFRGRDAISKLHQGMWNGVPKRTHRPAKVFPFGDNANTVVIIGTVEYWMDDGLYVKKDMAAQAKYQRSSKTGGIEMSSLQVWLTG